MNYWQVAAGSESRDYSRDFLRYGLAFVGSTRSKEAMRAVQLGDRVVLKRGVSEIVAAGVVVERDGPHRGEVIEPLHWLRDYDGWDLPAYCRVAWQHPSKPVPVKGLSRGTLRQVHHQPIRQVADDILYTAPVLPVEPEPKPTQALSDDEMIVSLMRSGLRPASAVELTDTLQRIRLLARYYYNECRWEDIREHEARTFLIIPFLLALGWSEQQIKIELGVDKGRIDIACFRRPYRRAGDGSPNNGDCVLILESKGFSQGLDYAHGQGKSYAAAFSNCSVVVTSNGYCYKAYKRSKDAKEFEDTPSAYLNLLKPKRSYPLDPGKANGGLELLSYLMPQRA